MATALRAVGGSAAEVLLCEHDETPRLEGDWPEGVRHVFVPAAVGEAFNKSKALNAGALAARHPVLLLHDADVWPPEDYVAKCLDFMAREGWEAVRPIRFLFLLDAESSSRVIASASVQDVRDVAQVQQNNPGLSAFVRKDVYLEIGGHDERFTGWGWEDVDSRPPEDPSALSRFVPAGSPSVARCAAREKDAQLEPRPAGRYPARAG